MSLEIYIGLATHYESSSPSVIMQANRMVLIDK